jgi:hypothetical protein
VTILLTILAVLGYLLVFWYIYVLVMGLYRAYLDKRLVGFPLYLSAPALVVGYIVDLFSNWTIASLVFWEMPNRPLELVTDRLSAYLKYDTGWRRKLAESICTSLLDYFDPSGTHCQGRPS